MTDFFKDLDIEKINESLEVIFYFSGLIFVLTKDKVYKTSLQSQSVFKWLFLVFETPFILYFDI